jgi:hypothetical protein
VRLFPDWGTLPSESTIEQVGNSLILRALEPRPAWFFVPTRREEATRAYDASLQGFKNCVIQYKRAAILKKARGVTVRLNVTQHQNLLKWYPAHVHPHVFIGLAEYWTYAEMGADVARGGIIGASPHLLLVDAHQIPAGTRQIDIIRTHPTGEPIAFPRTGKSRTAPPTTCSTIPEFVRSLISCKVGVQSMEHSDVVGSSDLPLPRVSVLFASPVAAQTFGPIGA